MDAITNSASSKEKITYSIIVVGGYKYSFSVGKTESHSTSAM
jgi:hypothetical protein